MSRIQKFLYIVPPSLLVVALIGLPLQSQGVQSQGFRIEEATIAGIHQAIRQGQITCVGLVQAYLARARAYNHTSDRLVTRDGAPIPPAPGTMRADIHNDRSGIHCRSVTDSAKVLDALKDPVSGYYDPRDVFTTVPRASVREEPYASSAATPGSSGPER